MFIFFPFFPPFLTHFFLILGLRFMDNLFSIEINFLLMNLFIYGDGKLKLCSILLFVDYAIEGHVRFVLSCFHIREGGLVTYIETYKLTFWRAFWTNRLFMLVYSYQFTSSLGRKTSYIISCTKVKFCVNGCT